jgi:hypothetical protein
VATEVLTLAGFLLARIAEDEEQGTAGEHWDLSDWSAADDVPVQFWDYGETHIGYRRFLAECEAKRRIVAALCDYDDGHVWASAEAFRAETALVALAQPYADHPDFRPEWLL